MSLPRSIQAWAAKEKGSSLSQIEIPLPPLKSHEVLLEVYSCGICHSDIHLIDNDWKSTKYPLVPGHEIIGKVIAKGSSAVQLKEGSMVGVGWQRGACLQCEYCLSERDNMCAKKTRTCVGFHGGYANYHVADWNYAFPMPENCLDPKFAPLLCAGITVYSPFREFINPKIKKPRVGVIGIGGLGHMAVKIAHAMDAEVTAFSSSPSKEKEAKKMGADHFVASTSSEAVTSLGPSFDFILVTANVDLNWSDYLKTLRIDGTMCFVGIPPSPLIINMDDILDKRSRITGSPIGSRIQMTQMLEFCASRGISPDSEMFKFQDVNNALEKVRKNQIHYRAVLAK
jgi:uncharacterized zinc-type alcohol dehydrogenase-like protein